MFRKVRPAFVSLRRGSLRFCASLQANAGGWGGIRTLGAFRHTRFPGVHNRPLCHPSCKDSTIYRESAVGEAASFPFLIKRDANSVPYRVEITSPDRADPRPEIPGPISPRCLP